MFRLVVYTASGSAYANTVIEAIDRHNLIHERLYRKDNVKVEEKLCKDLGKLSKHMDRALLIDSRAETCLQVENQLKIKSFYGDAKDTELRKLADFFKDKVSEIQHNIDLRELPDQYAALTN